MKKIITLLMGVFLLVACSNEDDMDNPIIDEKDTDTYVFESIRYYYEDVNDLQISTYKSSITYRNIGEVPIEITIGPIETTRINRTSHFFPDEKPNVNLEIDDSLKISVPCEYSADILSLKIGSWFSISGLEEWKYSEEKEELPYAGNTATSKTKLPAHSKVYTTYDYTRYELTALYEATFIGKESGKIIKVTGKWKGEWYSLDGSNIIIEPIE